MNFSFELSGALLTGNINPDAMTGMGALAGAILGGFAMIRIVIVLALVILMIASWWRIFTKAGLPGWGALIPVYNIYLMFKVGGRSGRNVLWMIIPPVLVVLLIINIFNIATRFGKHWTYGIGMLLLKVIFVPILAFDDSKYLETPTKVKEVKTPTATTTPVVKTVTKPVAKAVTKAPAKKPVTKVVTKPTAKVVAKAPAKKPAAKATSKPVIKKAPAKKK